RAQVAPLPSPLEGGTLHRLAAELSAAGYPIRTLRSPLPRIRTTRLPHGRLEEVLKLLLEGQLRGRHNIAGGAINGEITGNAARLALNGVVDLNSANTYTGITSTG